MDISTNKCPNCAGGLTTSADKRKKICPFCGTEFNIDYVAVPNVTDDDRDEVVCMRQKKSDSFQLEACCDREKICNDFLSQIGELKKDFKITPELIRGLRIPRNENVFLAHDDTVFQNGKRGFAVTEKGIYCRSMLEKLQFISYLELKEFNSLRWKYPESDNKGTIMAGDFNIAECVIVDTRIKDELMVLMLRILISAKETA